MDDNQHTEENVATDPQLPQRANLQKGGKAEASK